jgi:hypothetical protein
MKSYCFRALALLLLCVPAFTQTTPNLGMNIPSAGSNVGTWGPLLFTGEFELVIMIEVVTEEMVGSD